jgi:peptidyl-prolyl cis-trans isomerase SurA
MKKSAVFFLLILSLISACWVGDAKAELTVDRILVVVNDEIITESDLRMALAPVEARLKATLSGEALDIRLAEAREFFLEQLINDRLVLSEARANNVAVEEPEIDEMMNEIRAKFPTQEVFEATLREQGMSYHKMRERFKADIIKKKMTDFKVRSRIMVSPGEIKDYYDAHRDEFGGNAEVRVRQILIRTGETRTGEEAKLLAQSIVDKINAGEDMEELAAKFSEGSDAVNDGDMGWIKQGQMIERIDRQLFSMNVGENTGLVKSQLGYHIFRIEEVKYAEPKAFEDLQNEIRNKIYDIKKQAIGEEWIKGLREHAYIAYQG